jgi:hypothetical protein
LHLTSAEGPVYELTSFLVDNLALQSYRGDPEYFRDGFQSPDRSCWMCNTGAGAAAAVLATFGGPRAARYRRLAVSTFTDAIRLHQQPDGAYLNEVQPNQGSGIPTIFFGVELGEAYVELNRTLSEVTRNLWANALSRAASLLVSQGLLTRYVNGNLNLQFTELLWDAWRATGSRSLHDDYERSWAFMLSPGGQYSGSGLVYSHHGKGANGSNSSGYLTESDGDEPGFDPEYSAFQADEAARLYMLSSDPRALLLMNLLTNKLLPRVTAGFLLSTSGGSRHPTPGRYVPFTTSAVPVLSWLGSRRDLERDVAGQFRELRTVACQNLQYPYATLYRALGNELSVDLMATKYARASGKGLRSRPLCTNLPPALFAKLAN